MKVERCLKRLKCQMGWEMNAAVVMVVWVLARTVILMLTLVHFLLREDYLDTNFGSDHDSVRKIWSAMCLELLSSLFVVLRAWR